MSELTPAEQAIEQRALEYAKARSNRMAIARKVVAGYPAEKQPTSVFMAGSPGAGKTEASKELITQLGGNILRIDADELREEFDEYTGSNSHLFQSAVTRLVDGIFDEAQRKGISFVLDTTLSHYDKAVRNIERALNRDRQVIIIYVYQEPQNAWRFVQAREEIEGRRILPEVFIEQFLEANAVVNRLIQHFGDAIRVDVLVKNVDGQNLANYFDVSSVDHYIDRTYDRTSLAVIVGLTDLGGDNAK